MPGQCARQCALPLPNLGPHVRIPLCGAHRTLVFYMPACDSLLYLAVSAALEGAVGTATATLGLLEARLLAYLTTFCLHIGSGIGIGIQKIACGDTKCNVNGGRLH